MALEFICSDGIEKESISVPRWINNGKVLVYELDHNNRKITFFSADRQEAEAFVLNRWKVPENARQMKFDLYRNNGLCIVGAPVFYGSKEEILKIGNR
jgi:hypothetical protein